MKQSAYSALILREKSWKREGVCKQNYSSWEMKSSLKTKIHSQIIIYTSWKILGLTREVAAGRTW